jgi:undecaprenyl-diphosphatase
LSSNDFVLKKPGNQLSLIAILQHYDTRLFYFLNHLIAHPFWDWFWVTITTQKNWIVPLLAVVIGLVWKDGRRGRVAVVLALLAVGASDMISARVLKPGVGRLRPCHELENVRLLVSCGGKHGFPSSHAANSFAVALTLAYFYRRYTSLCVTFASLVGLSRIIVGVHYPGDVLGGFILGGLCAGFFVFLSQKLKSVGLAGCP